MDEEFDFSDILDSILQEVNPRNWGLNDYSKTPFATAFKTAKTAEDSEFLWNGRRYNTKSNLSPTQTMKRYGITDEQRAGKNIITDRAYRTVQPYYRNNSSEGYRQFIKGETRIPESERAIEYDGRGNELDDDFGLYKKDYEPVEDACALYTGNPQKFNSFELSDYKPTKSTDPNAQYFKLKALEQYLPELKEYLTTSESVRKLKPGDKMVVNGREFFGSNRLNLLFRNFTIGKGKDEKGDYVYYYDKFNLNPSAEFPMPEQGKPVEIYDRYYLNDYDFNDILD